MPVGFQHKPIASSSSLGQQLKAARRKKHASLDTAEQETKIRRRYLEALEDDRALEIPASHLKGFIRRYAEYLGLASGAIEREVEFLSSASPAKQPFSPRPLRERPQWLVTPRVVAAVASILVLLTFIGYVIYQVRQFAAPPLLVITKPSGDSAVTQETFSLEGKTDPGASVSVEGLLANVKPDGTFDYPLRLRPGLNQITVRADNRIKKETIRIVSLLYQPPGVLTSPIPSISP